MIKCSCLLAPLLLLGCMGNTNENNAMPDGSVRMQYPSIGDIPTPPGYQRVSEPAGSFGAWLRHISLKKDNRVHLYNGDLKRNQEAQFAVLDIPVGESDLQQCADAIMRLRAEYFFANKKYDSIHFLSTSGQAMEFSEWKNGTRYHVKGNRLVAYQDASAVGLPLRQALDSFLPFVFTYAGTLSLEHQLHPVTLMSSLKPGDVLVRGGSPGHAMLVTDVAINGQGKKVYLLSQSYMPAQDIHIVKNPANADNDPWYELDERAAIVTPEWKFSVSALREW
jgi:Domain of unknown function (4846)